MKQQDEQTEQEMIDDYKRVESFLADVAVKRAIGAVADGITDEFRNTKTPQERELLFAKLKALDGLADELMKTMGRGQLALAQRLQRERNEETAQRVADRRRGNR